MSDLGWEVVARRGTRWRRWRCFWSWPPGHDHRWLGEDERAESGYAMQCTRCGHLISFNDII